MLGGVEGGSVDGGGGEVVGNEGCHCFGLRKIVRLLWRRSAGQGNSSREKNICSRSDDAQEYKRLDIKIYRC